MVALDELDSTLDLRVSEIRVSISSIKMIHGCIQRAFLNSYLTREAPTPTNISSKSDPEQKIKLQPDSPAIARAINVLPVPGSPYSIIPLCNLHPFSRYLSGSCSILITFYSSSLISSMPRTSASRQSMSFDVLTSNLGTTPKFNSGFKIQIKLIHPTNLMNSKSTLWDTLRQAS